MPINLAKDFWNTVDNYDQQIQSIFVAPGIIGEALAEIPGKPQKVVGDFGCGPGNAFGHLHDFRKVYGVDFSERMLAVAKSKQESNVELIQADIAEVTLPEPCDVALGLASIMPLNTAHFYGLFDNILRNTRNDGTIFMALPSFESRTLAFHLRAEHLHREGYGPHEAAQVLLAEIEEYQYNPMGYILTNTRTVQKHWLYDEILFRLGRYNFQNIAIHRYELDWERQVKWPHAEGFPQLWFWFVEILR